MVPLVRVFLVVLFATSVVCETPGPVSSSKPDNEGKTEGTSDISPKVASADGHVSIDTHDHEGYASAQEEFDDTSKTPETIDLSHRSFMKRGDFSQPDPTQTGTEQTVEVLLENLSEESRKLIIEDKIMMDILNNLTPLTISDDDDENDEGNESIEIGIIETSINSVYVQKYQGDMTKDDQKKGSIVEDDKSRSNDTGGQNGELTPTDSGTEVKESKV